VFGNGQMFGEDWNIQLEVSTTCGAVFVGGKKSSPNECRILKKWKN
jgi:hypothetical protein